MTVAAETPDKYENAKRERKKFVDEILSSKATRKVVVAGPGTGKSYLFKMMLESRQNSLTLTFINSLVQDLALDLCGLSEVRTLHGFARSIVSGIDGGAAIYPRLSTVIAEDAEVLEGQSTDFEFMLFEMNEAEPLFKFHSGRKKYYGHYGHADIVFEAVKHFQKSDENIPSYEQIVIDEFQDFNELEVALIELLSRKSPTLLVGDDDQALYDFKNASPDHIRKLHRTEAKDHASFSLPYCSRCTRAVVEATNDVIEGAVRNGLLNDRIEKSYIYFDDRKKDRDCEKFDRLSYT